MGVSVRVLNLIMSVRVISVLLVNAVTHGGGGRPDIKHGTTDEHTDTHTYVQ